MIPELSRRNCQETVHESTIEAKVKIYSTTSVSFVFFLTETKYTAKQEVRK